MTGGGEIENSNNRRNAFYGKTHHGNCNEKRTLFTLPKDYKLKLGLTQSQENEIINNLKD